MRRAAILLGSALFATVPEIGRAADKNDRAACIAAASEAQALLDGHRLLAARDRLRVCGRVGCPSAVLRDCVTWLGETEASLSALVFEARSAEGVELVDVKVSIDGVEVATKLDGIAIEVDPGPHAVLFETADGARVEQQVVARTAEKHTVVSVTLPTPVAAPPAPEPTPIHVEAEPPVSTESSPTGGSPETLPPPPANPPPVGSQMRAVAYSAGALAVVGLGIGTGFGLEAISKRNELDCHGTVCNAQALNGGQFAATGADVAFAAAGAQGALAVALFVTAPRAPAQSRGAGASALSIRLSGPRVDVSVSF